MTSPVIAALALTPVALLGFPGAAALLPAASTPAIALADTGALIVGPSGTPIPSQAYIDAVTSLYVDPAAPFPGQPVFGFDHADPVFTPAGLQPLDGIKLLPLDTSVAQGTTILDATIAAQFAAGNHVVVSGYSQSSTIASEVMKDLLALPPADVALGTLAGGFGVTVITNAITGSRTPSPDCSDRPRLGLF